MYNGGYGQNQYQGQQPLYGTPQGGLGSQQTGFQQQPQYGLAPQQTGFQPTFQQHQQPQQGQLNSYQSQLNQGYQQQQPMYSQPTGYVQPQQTGFVGQSFLQPQQTGFATQQPPLAVQPTGFTSAAQRAPKNESLKIPNIRLSFLTAQDQTKYEQLFRSAVEKGSNALNADSARDILMKSGLQPTQLGRIWELSDLNKSGRLLFPEFALSLHLVNIALSGRPVPQVLEPSTKREVEGFVDAINFSVPDEEDHNAKTPFDNIPSQQQQNTLNQLGGLQFGQTASQPLQSQATGFQALQPQGTGFGLQPQATGYQAVPPPVSFGFQPQATGFGQPLQPQTGFGQPLQPQRTGFQHLQPQLTGYAAPLLPQATGVQQTQLLQAQKTGVGNNTLFQTNLLQPQKTGFQNINQYHNYNHGQEFIKPEEKQLFSKIFETYDIKRSGLLDGKTSAEIFRKSGLNRSELEKVWNLITVNDQTHLNKESFSLGMWLIYKKLNGHELPNRLPDHLLPDSNKILNGVKEQLKAQPSTFGKGASVKKVDEPSSLDLLKSKIEQNKIQLESLNVQIANNTSSKPTTNDEENLRAIEVLKNQIKSLPTGSNSGEKLQLRDKLSSLTSRVPELIREIVRIDNEITESRIELYKIKNPSTIVGTGPNGEVTEADKRKAKNKALLNQRMAALTGKAVTDPTVDFDEQQRKFEQEVASYRAKSKENQENIYDIEKTIKDLSQGAQETLSKGSEGGLYRKFDLGIDVQPETAQFIKELRQSRGPGYTAPASTTASPAIATPTPSQEVRAPSQSEPIAKSSTPDSYSSYKTPEDRAAFIKEQAKKKMNERLARFGLSRNRSSSDQSTPTTPPAKIASSTPVQPVITSPSSAAQEAVEQQQPKAQVKKSQPPPVIKASAPPPPPKTRSAPPKVEAAIEESEDEDEEEKKLRQRLEDLKLKKKAEKEARQAELQRQLAEAEKEEEVIELPVEEKMPQTFAPQPVEPVATPPVTVAASPAPKAVQHHDSNPFAKSFGGSSKTVASNNPFGRQTAAKPIAAPLPSSSVDKSKIEAQRKAQRGQDDDDDDWGSDDDHEVSDDDEDLPNRQGAAHLAGLLFSGMGPARTNSSSEIPTPKQETPKAKPVPIAAPLPSISSNSVPTVKSVVEDPTAQQAPPISTPPIQSLPPPIPQAPVQEVPSAPVAPSVPEEVHSQAPTPTPAPAPAPAPAPPLPEAPTLEGFEQQPPSQSFDDADPYAAPQHAVPQPPAFIETPAVPAQTEFYQAVDPSGSEIFSTPTGTSPAPEEAPAAAPPLVPQAEAPAIPSFEATSAPPPPEVDAPPPPPLPEFSAPPPPPLPQVGTSTSLAPEEVPAVAPPPVPQVQAPAIPTFEAPPAPPLPDFNAPPPPPLPEFSAPPPPPLPQADTPLAPPPPPPPAELPSSAPISSPPAPLAGGLPFLAEINKRRDESNVVG